VGAGFPEIVFTLGGGTGSIDCSTLTVNVSTITRTGQYTEELAFSAYATGTLVRIVDPSDVVNKIIDATVTGKTLNGTTSIGWTFLVTRIPNPGNYY
jgi:hypothetical protein